MSHRETQLNSKKSQSQECKVIDSGGSDFGDPISLRCPVACEGNRPSLINRIGLQQALRGMEVLDTGYLVTCTVGYLIERYMEATYVLGPP